MVDGQPVAVSFTPVSPSFFTTLFDAPPLLGRWLDARDDERGGEVSVIVSAAFWQRVTHSDPDIVGRSFVFNGDRLFRAAIDLFYRHGIRAVSVDAIAAEAGTTKVTFYRVFESKDDLVVQVLEEQSKRFWEWWDAIVAEHPNEPRKQIEALVCHRTHHPQATTGR